MIVSIKVMACGLCFTGYDLAATGRGPQANRIAAPRGTSLHFL